MRRPLPIALLLLLSRATLAQEDPYARAAAADPLERAKAAQDLALLPEDRAGQTLIVLLVRDLDPHVRASAALALERRGDPTFHTPLEVTAAQDPSPQVRAAAKRAHAALEPRAKRPRVAAGLGLYVPGLGHFYLGRYGEGAAYLASTAALIGGAFLILSNNEVSPDLGNPERLDTVQPADPLAIPLLIGAQNLIFYQIFDAYRDARLLRGEWGLRISTTRESLGTLASAPFRPSVLKSPWVWAVVPAAFGLGLGLSYLIQPDDFGRGEPSIFDVDRVNVFGRLYSRGIGFGIGELYWAATFVSVGVGEEALFRGFLQTELDEAWGPWAGWATASVLFGAIHIFNFTQPGTSTRDALYAVPYITLVGSTMGLAYMRTGYRLQTGVAMHFWYDFLLATASFVVDPQHQPFIARFGMTF